MKIGEIVIFKYKNEEFKGEFLEEQINLFDEKIIKLKLLSPDEKKLLNLSSNKLLLLKNNDFLSPYVEKKEKIEKPKIQNKKATPKSNSKRNYTLF